MASPNPQAPADPAAPSRLAVLWCALAALVLLAFGTHLVYGWEVDEMTHLQTAWKIGQGEVPYRDFFEHHPPLYHALLAPATRLWTEAYGPAFWTLRFAALLLSLWWLRALHRLGRAALPPHAAVWAVAAVLLLHPFQTVGVELRPDWPALALVILSMHALWRALRDRQDMWVPAEGAPRTARLPELRSAAAAGLYAGLAACLSQKAWFLLVGITLWGAGAVIFAPAGAERRGRAAALLLFVSGMAAPLLLLYAWFARVGLGWEFVYYSLFFNTGFSAVDPWRRSIQESLMAGFGVYVLAAAEAARVIRGFRREWAEVTLDSLVVATLLIGVAAHIKTTAPTPQSFLFLVVPWAAFLSARAVMRYIADLGEARADRHVIACSALVCAIGLTWINALAALLAWSVIGWLILRRLRRLDAPTPAERRVGAVYAGLLTVSLLLFVGRTVNVLQLQEGREQARLMARIGGLAPPGSPVLTIWPNVAPFRPHPTYHWFAPDAPLLVNLPREALQDEYIDAVRQGRARVVAVNPESVGRYMPRFQRHLDEQCRRQQDTPRTRHDVMVYVCGP